MIDNSIKVGMKRIDVYFMTGLPFQTIEDAGIAGLLRVVFLCTWY